MDPRPGRYSGNYLTTAGRRVLRPISKKSTLRAEQTRQTALLLGAAPTRGGRKTGKTGNAFPPTGEVAKVTYISQGL